MFLAFLVPRFFYAEDTDERKEAYRTNETKSSGERETLRRKILCNCVFLLWYSSANVFSVLTTTNKSVFDGAHKGVKRQDLQGMAKELEYDDSVRTIPKFCPTVRIFRPDVWKHQPMKYDEHATLRDMTPYSMSGTTKMTFETLKFWNQREFYLFCLSTWKDRYGGMYHHTICKLWIKCKISKEE
jgi:hypothetical protein